MRIAKVVGKVILNRKLDCVPAGSLLLISVLDRRRLAGASLPGAADLVAFDNMGAREGDRIAISEGREASNPFYPAKVPFDAYCAAILDSVSFEPVLPVR